MWRQLGVCSHDTSLTPVYSFSLDLAFVMSVRKGFTLWQMSPNAEKSKGERSTHPFFLSLLVFL